MIDLYIYINLSCNYQHIIYKLKQLKVIENAGVHETRLKYIFLTHTNILYIVYVKNIFFNLVLRTLAV